MPREVIVVGERMLVRSPFRWPPETGVWYGRIRDKKTGRVWKVSSYLKDERKALSYLVKWAEKKIKELEGQVVDLEGRTFGKAFQEWIELRPKLRPSTRKDYESAKKGFVKAFGEVLVSEVGPVEVEKYLAELGQNGRAATTQQKYLVLLRSFFSWAVRRRLCAANPTDGLRAARGERRRGIALSHEQARKLLEKCRESYTLELELKKKGGRRKKEKWEQTNKPPRYLWLAVLISLHTGLRKINVLGLKWREVDLQKGAIRISRERMKGKADLEIPIHPELLEVLKGVLQGLLDEDKEVGLDDPVVGKGILDLKGSFASAVKRAGLVKDGEGEPGFRWHDLRHTFATWVGSRATLPQLQALLGHSPGSISLQYTHPPFAELKEVVCGMPRLISGDSVTSLCPVVEH